MYKNIIFDLGGVMVDFDPKTYLVDRFCNAEVEEQVSQLTFESEEWKLLDAGPMTERDLKGLFDGGVASCEVHINKPDPRIYKALLDKYQLKAGESVFIDDRLENVQAAFRLGFAGIQMKDSVGTLVRSLATCSVVIH
mgnify:CR=1 FL=1